MDTGGGVGAHPAIRITSTLKIVRLMEIMGLFSLVAPVEDCVLRIVT
jgi:hypothetical protein